MVTLWKSLPAIPPIAAVCYGAAMEFSTGAALRFGWETFKKRPWFFVGSTFVILLASGLINGFTGGIDAASPAPPRSLRSSAL